MYKKTSLLLVSTKVFLKLVLLQPANGLCSPTLFVLLWFWLGERAVWAGYDWVDRARPGLDVLMSFVCTVQREYDAWSSFAIVQKLLVAHFPLL